eukprot:14446-Heterococcus_DN1.PRE.6
MPVQELLCSVIQHTLLPFAANKATAAVHAASRCDLQASEWACQLTLISFSRRTVDSYSINVCVAKNAGGGIVPEALYAYNNSTRRSSSRRSKRDRGDDAIDVDDMSDDDDSDADDHSDQGLDHDRIEWTSCEVHYARDDVASIFATSARGKAEFPDAHENLRSAVSLARGFQDTLAEYAGLWTTMDSSGEFGTALLSLRLHPLQSELATGQLLRALEQRGAKSAACMHTLWPFERGRRLCARLSELAEESNSYSLKVWWCSLVLPSMRRTCSRMIDAVNDAGVDLNMACEQEHMRGLLQFVAGLGPRKAAALRTRISQIKLRCRVEHNTVVTAHSTAAGISALRQHSSVTDLSGVVVSRRQLLDKGLMGPLTYTNAAAFLRIRKKGRLEERDDLNPFDDTRIHTECYIKHHWARQICANALDVDPEDYVQVVSVSVQRSAHLYDIALYLSSIPRVLYT